MQLNQSPISSKEAPYCLPSINLSSLPDSIAIDVKSIPPSLQPRLMESIKISYNYQPTKANNRPRPFPTRKKSIK